jgi:hypothetical protein
MVPDRPSTRPRRETTAPPERHPRTDEGVVWRDVAPTALLDRLAVGVVVHEAGVAVYANQTALDLLGMQSKRLLGRAPLGRDWRVQREDGSDLPETEQPALVALRIGRPDWRPTRLGAHRRRPDRR